MAPLLQDGLWDAYSDQHMGSCAELCATKHSFDREAQDLFAAESYRRAIVRLRRLGLRAVGFRTHWCAVGRPVRRLRHPAVRLRPRSSLWR